MLVDRACQAELRQHRVTTCMHVEADPGLHECGQATCPQIRNLRLAPNSDRGCGRCLQFPPGPMRFAVDPCICQDLLNKCLAISELCACCMADLPRKNFVLGDSEPTYTYVRLPKLDVWVLKSQAQIPLERVPDLVAGEGERGSCLFRRDQHVKKTCTSRTWRCERGPEDKQSVEAQLE